MKIDHSIYKILILSISMLQVKTVFNDMDGHSLNLVKSDKSDNTSYTIGLDNVNDPIWQRLTTQAKDSLAIGLITNQTGKSATGKRTVDVLLARGIPIRYLFAPEHGMDGSVSAEKEVLDSIDTVTNIPVISLYGKAMGKQLAVHHLTELDLLIFDMQDCGMRHYTYISTLLHCMQMASKHDIPFMVLDRPNPLGIRMEGPVCNTEKKSFIAAAPIPLRHGMTIGELARYFNKYILEKKAQLYIVALHQYERTMPFTDTLCMPLSPNISSLSACYGYSFLGLLGEVRPFDCGLGTKHAMSCLGLCEDIKFSDAQWISLQKLLAQSGLPSQIFTYYSPRKKKKCRGLQFAIQDMSAIASYEILLKTLKFFQEQGLNLKFSSYFDIAVGTPLVREYAQGIIAKPKLDRETIDKLLQFYKQAQSVYIYKPWPRII